MGARNPTLVPECLLSDPAQPSHCHKSDPHSSAQSKMIRHSSTVKRVTPVRGRSLHSGTSNLARARDHRTQRRTRSQRPRRQCEQPSCADVREAVVWPVAKLAMTIRRCPICRARELGSLAAFTTAIDAPWRGGPRSSYRHLFGVVTSIKLSHMHVRWAGCGHQRMQRHV